MKIGIIGAGLIGQQWSMLFSTKPFINVILFDIYHEQITKAQMEIKKSLQYFRDQQISRTDDSPDDQMTRIHFTCLLSELPKDMDFVMECVPENLELKRATFIQLNDYFSPNTILMSSSSYMTISTLTEGLSNESNCIIAHPLNPPYFLRLVEICPSTKTKMEVVEKTKQLMLSIDQKPIVLKKEIHGFCINRIQAAVYNSLFNMLQNEIVDSSDMDILLTEGLAPRWSFFGPLDVASLNGPGLSGYFKKYLSSIDQINEIQNFPPQHNKEVINTITSSQPNLDDPKVVSKLAEGRNKKLGDLLKVKLENEK